MRDVGTHPRHGQADVILSPRHGPQGSRRARGGRRPAPPRRPRRPPNAPPHAGAGPDIAITYLERTDAARETTAAVEALGRRAWSVALDQTKAESIPAAVEAVAKHYGRLDILVNNAAWNISI